MNDFLCFLFGFLGSHVNRHYSLTYFETEIEENYILCKEKPRWGR